MRVECFRVCDVFIIRVIGPLDPLSADGLRARAGDVLRRGQQTVVVNLGGVGWIDAAGVGALADLHRLTTQAAGRVALTDLRPRVREMLDLVGITPLFDIAASECDAVEDLHLCI